MNKPWEKILAIAQVENSEYIEGQLQKQTIQPDEIKIHVDPDPATGIDERRKRIAANHNNHLREIVEASDCELVFQVEGDAELPPYALEILYEDYNALKYTSQVGYVSGIQVGRHGLYAIGAWKFNKNRTEFWSIDYRKEGVHEIHATGFYCLLAPREAWLDGNCNWDGERWGPDVNFGLSLKDQGYDLYVDMDLKVGHRIKNGIIRPQDMSTTNVHFFQRNDGTWTFKVSG